MKRKLVLVSLTARGGRAQSWARFAHVDVEAGRSSSEASNIGSIPRGDWVQDLFTQNDSGRPYGKYPLLFVADNDEDVGAGWGGFTIG